MFIVHISIVVVHRGVGARALSNGINSAVFFCFFEALRASFKKRKEQASPILDNSKYQSNVGLTPKGLQYESHYHFSDHRRNVPENARQFNTSKVWSISQEMKLEADSRMTCLTLEEAHVMPLCFTPPIFLGYMWLRSGCHLGSEWVGMFVGKIECGGRTWSRAA